MKKMGELIMYGGALLFSPLWVPVWGGIQAGNYVSPPLQWVVGILVTLVLFVVSGAILYGLALAGIIGTKKEDDDDDDDDDDEIVNGISPTGRYREARPGNGNGNDYGN